MNPQEIDHEVLTIKEICDLLQVHLCVANC